jgi:hypothetical protein
MITMDEGSKKLNGSLLVEVDALFAAPLARTHTNTTVNCRGSIFFNRIEWGFDATSSRIQSTDWTTRRIICAVVAKQFAP